MLCADLTHFIEVVESRSKTNNLHNHKDKVLEPGVSLLEQLSMEHSAFGDISCKLAMYDDV